MKLNDFELILINDFSKDDSWEKIKKLSKNYSYIKGINLSENFGQHNALMAGLNYSNGDCVITLMMIYNILRNFFPNIFEQLKIFDVCYTNYKNRKHDLEESSKQNK